MTTETLSLRDRIAAKLLVLIEGVADHKISPHNQEDLAKEVVDDIRRLCAEVSRPKTF